jgi:hypothetical protein
VHRIGPGPVLQSPTRGRFQITPVPSDRALLGQLPPWLPPCCRFLAIPGSASPRMRCTALSLSLSHPLNEVQSIFSSPLTLLSLCSSSHTKRCHWRERHHRASNVGAATLVRRVESSLSVPSPQALAPHQGASSKIHAPPLPPRSASTWIAPPATELPHRLFHEYHADEDLLHEPLPGRHNPQSGSSSTRPSAPIAPTWMRVSGEPLTSPHLEPGPPHSGAPLAPPPRPDHAAGSPKNGRRRRPVTMAPLPCFSHGL